MSMQNYANAGYVIPVSEMFPMFGAEVTEKLKPLIEEQEREEAEEILDANWPKEFPKFNSVFVMGSEDESEDLQVGEMYIEFDEADLYERRPTDAMKQMEAKGIIPVDSKWVTFG